MTLALAILLLLLTISFVIAFSRRSKAQRELTAQLDYLNGAFESLTNDATLAVLGSERLRLALDQLRAGVVIVDSAGQETIRNQVAKRYTDARHADSLVEGALTEALDEGKVKPNSKILFLAFGGGLTGAAAVIDWGGRSHALKTSNEQLPDSSKTAIDLVQDILNMYK